MQRNITDSPAPSTPYKMLAVLWLVGWTLRVPILAAPPLATDIANSFALGEAGVGALTMLPVIAIAFGAIPAARIIARCGLRAAIVGGLLIMGVASVARGQVASASMLFAMSVLMGLGVALFQTALPSATRIWTPKHIALGSAVYLNGMMLGEVSGAGLTLPIILPLAGGDWRFALMLWAVPILLIAVLVTFKRLPDEASASEGVYLAHADSLPRWNDPRVWQYGMLLASSVVAFFVINAYCGSVLQARGEADALGDLLLAYNVTPLLASLAVLKAPHWIGSRNAVGISAVFAAIGLAGFIILDGWPSWISAVLAGFAATVELILLVSLPPTVAKGRAVTRLSAGMTLIGFSVAFLLPLIGGWLADWAGRVEIALIPSLVFMVVALTALGRTARYPAYE